MSMRAFTLVEVLIVMSISVLVALAVSDLGFRAYSVAGYQDARAYSTAGAGTAWRQLSADIHEADQVLASHTFTTGVTYTSGASQIVLELPITGADGRPLADAHDYIAYYVSGGVLYRVTNVDPLSTRHLQSGSAGDGVGHLSYTYDSATWADVDQVTVDLAMISITKALTVSAPRQATFVLKNRL